MDRRDWWATVHEVTKSWTWLSNWTHSHTLFPKAHLTSSSRIAVSQWVATPLRLSRPLNPFCLVHLRHLLSPLLNLFCFCYVLAFFVLYCFILAWNVADLGSVAGLGTSPGEGKGYSLQDSSLENSTVCIAHRVAKSRTWLSDFHFCVKYPLDSSDFPEISSHSHFGEISSCSLFLCIVHLIRPSYCSLLFSRTLELKQTDCVLSSLSWRTSIQSANKVLELTVAQVISSILQNWVLNWRK